MNIQDNAKKDADVTSLVGTYRLRPFRQRINHSLGISHYTLIKASGSQRVAKQLHVEMFA